MMELKLTGNTYGELIAQAKAWLGDAASVPQQPQPTPVAPVQPAVTQAAPIAPVPAMGMPQAAPAPVPTAAPTYSQEDLMVAAARVMSTAGMPAMQQLLGQFGVQAITQLPPAQYGAFAQRLREMGAAI